MVWWYLPSNSRAIPEQFPARFEAVNIASTRGGVVTEGDQTKFKLPWRKSLIIKNKRDSIDRPLSRSFHMAGSGEGEEESFSHRPQSQIFMDVFFAVVRSAHEINIWIIHDTVCHSEMNCRFYVTVLLKVWKTNNGGMLKIVGIGHWLSPGMQPKEHNH